MHHAYSSLHETKVFSESISRVERNEPIFEEETNFDTEMLIIEDKIILRAPSFNVCDSGFVKIRGKCRKIYNRGQKH